MTRKLKLGMGGLLQKLVRSTDIDHYLRSGRIPWSKGYKQYRFNLLRQIPTDSLLLETFAKEGSLPANYGVGIDERIVEYPWVLSRIPKEGKSLLDGGSALNYPFLLEGPQLSTKRVVIMTLAPESTMTKNANVSYVFGDLRDTLFRDGAFDTVVSISTLEHIGMDNTMLYSQDDSHKESHPDDCLQVIREFRRLLKPGGRFLMTVPFGKPQNFGWLKQFDGSRLKQAIDAFGPADVTTTFFQYGDAGWAISDEAACKDCEYFDVHSAPAPATDLAAAARGVACLEFIRHD